MKTLDSFIKEANQCPKGYYFDDKSKSCQPKKSTKSNSYRYSRFGGGSKNGNGNNNGDSNENGDSGNDDSGNGNGGGNGGE
jgi:hypothetical protein